ncbi:uncharacterized protein FRV6_01214 [Fusarium oxysporum]|uniref:Uncharacterized protein n=1 Tax=Fusarium oxysporum TaxID=5507 RepID=A0A2H3SKJ1_FUSOX|nr:uncharacterized protein FRV6_01214 [Fusarium oxysporum]
MLRRAIMQGLPFRLETDVSFTVHKPYVGDTTAVYQLIIAQLTK